MTDGRNMTGRFEWRTDTSRWAIALALYVAALASLVALSDLMPPGFPYLTFFPAITLAAFICGRRQALAVAIAAGLTAWYFLAPAHGFALDFGKSLALGFFALIAGMDIWLVDRLRRSEGEAEAKEAQLRTIMETVPIGIVLAEFPSGRIVEGNRYVETLLRHPVLPSADVHSYDEWESYHADGSRVSGYEYPLARMAQNGEQTPEIEVNYRRGDGTMAWTRIMGRPVKDDSGKLVGGVVALVDTDTQKRAQEEAARAAEEFKALAENIPTLCWMARPDGEVYWYNRRWYEYTGYDETTLDGWGWEAVHDPQYLPRVVERWRQSLETGEPFELTFPLRRADGQFRLFLTRVVPIRDADGRIIRWFGANTDVDDLKQSEEREKLLAAEVDHRAKNLLAVVQSVIKLTRTDDPADLKPAIEGRVLSLATAHRLLANSRWEGVELTDLIHAEMAPYEKPDRALVLAGPAVQLGPAAAQAMCMLIHELVTNAAKYGALSSPTGRLSLTWGFAADAPALFELNWAESCGPSVAPPTRKGFGSTLIRTSVTRQLDGECSFEWRPEGLKFTLRAPLEALVSERRPEAS